MREMWDELEPLTDQEIDKLLGPSSSAAQRLAAALAEANPKELARADAFLQRAYQENLHTVQELSLVAKARSEFNNGNYAHLAIYRYLADKADQIFR